MLLGRSVWTYFGFDHSIVQNWTGAWLTIILAAVFGFVAIIFAKKTGFPDIWDEKISKIKSDFCIPFSWVSVSPS